MPPGKKSLQTTSLFDRHQADGAHFVELAGWQIPDYFDSANAEYEALRNTAGIFDLCHQGRLKVAGGDAIAALNKLTTIDIEELPENEEKNCYILNERAGIIDEVSIFKSDKFCTLHCSSLMKEKVQEWLQENGADFHDFDLADASTSQGSVQILGPMASAVLADSILDGEMPEFENSTSIAQIGQARCLITSKRYGISQGYRIDAGGLFLHSVWDRLKSIGANRGASPVGWRALELLRVEAGIPGTGAEIDEDTTPFEIGATLRVEISKGYFVGRKALLHSTAAEFQRRLVHLTFELDDVPRPGDSIEMDGIPVGYITSSALSPRLGSAIAMGFIDALKAMEGIGVEVRTRHDDILKAVIADPAEVVSKV